MSKLKHYCEGLINSITDANVQVVKGLASQRVPQKKVHGRQNQRFKNLIKTPQKSKVKEREESRSKRGRNSTGTGTSK